MSNDKQPRQKIYLVVDSMTLEGQYQNRRDTLGRPLYELIDVLSHKSLGLYVVHESESNEGLVVYWRYIQPRPRPLTNLTRALPNHNYVHSL